MVEEEKNQLELDSNEDQLNIDSDENQVYLNKDENQEYLETEENQGYFNSEENQGHLDSDENSDKESQILFSSEPVLYIAIETSINSSPEEKFTEDFELFSKARIKSVLIIDAST